MPPDSGVVELPDVDRWIARVRLALVALAILELGVVAQDFPPGYEAWAWFVTAVFTAGAIAIFLASRTSRPLVLLPVCALLFDTGVLVAYAVLFSYQYGSPTRYALIFVVVEGALRYGTKGGVLVAIALTPYLAIAEWWRADRFGPPDFALDRVTFPLGIFVITGLTCGWLVGRLAREVGRAAARAAEAERLRDELGRRIDVLESANRCARALSSSLKLDEAFEAFIQEVGDVIPFDRLMVMRFVERGTQVVSTAGLGTHLFADGLPEDELGRVLERVRDGRTQTRPDMAVDTQDEERPLLELGLRSRVVAPLQSGGRVIGVFSVSRLERDAFSAEEVEFVTLLGRLIATAVQNIRAFEAERATVEELRRLSALRADFVSMVSHELRSPMAAVIGSARTLQQRWRELRPEQREAFLAVIGDETARLANLIEDVLHTSRIEAGTFSYRFATVDLARLVGDSVSAAELAQDEVRVSAEIRPGVSQIRGDGERLRQLFDNLVSNAVKFSRTGQEVRVTLNGDNGVVRVAVRDDGPGIPVEHQGLIFEKFGRAAAGHAKPGTGLGLFIARSIAEAHGGSLEVQSVVGRGTTFTVTLPA
jgi:signal transduction histidine kinase